MDLTGLLLGRTHRRELDRRGICCAWCDQTCIEVYEAPGDRDPITGVERVDYVCLSCSARACMEVSRPQLLENESPPSPGPNREPVRAYYPRGIEN